MQSNLYEQRNIEHAANPKIGDYWHEMYHPVAVVIDVTPRHVITLEGTKSVDPDSWTWDVHGAEPKLYSREAFKYLFTYGRAGDSSFKGDPDPDSIKNSYWCNVMPEAHKWVAEEYNKEVKLESR